MFVIQRDIELSSEAGASESGVVAANPWQQLSCTQHASAIGLPRVNVSCPRRRIQETRRTKSTYHGEELDRPSDRQMCNFRHAKALDAVDTADGGFVNLQLAGRVEIPGLLDGSFANAARMLFNPSHSSQNSP